MNIILVFLQVRDVRFIHFDTSTTLCYFPSIALHKEVFISLWKNVFNAFVRFVFPNAENIILIQKLDSFLNDAISILMFNNNKWKWHQFNMFPWASAQIDFL